MKVTDDRQKIMQQRLKQKPPTFHFSHPSEFELCFKHPAVPYVQCKGPSTILVYVCVVNVNANFRDCKIADTDLGTLGQRIN